MIATGSQMEMNGNLTAKSTAMVITDALTRSTTLSLTASATPTEMALGTLTTCRTA